MTIDSKYIDGKIIIMTDFKIYRYFVAILFFVFLASFKKTN